MKEYNLAIVGLGGMGNWHRRLICGEGDWNNKKVGSPIANLKFAGSFDIREERQQFARDNGAPHVYSSLDEILADPKIDIVLCATPNDVHKEVVTRALRAGKNAVSEKPVTLGSKDLQDMINVSKETGKVFTVHQNRRWDDDFLTVKKMYEEDYLGEVFRIESRVHGSRGIPGDWRALPQHGGGMLLDWGVHILDQALQMIPGKVKYVFGQLTNITTDAVDDGFRAELTFENGMSYFLETSTNNFVKLPRWYVLGIDGTAVIKDFNLEGEVVRITDRSKNDAIPVRTSAGITKTMAPRTNDTIKTEALPIVHADIREFYRNVIATIEGTETQHVKLEEVMRNMKLMEAIVQSAREHRVVEFE